MVIVGGGISGLFAARVLFDAGFRDFKVVTKKLVERIDTSENGLLNYATFFVCNRYLNLMPYVRKTGRILLTTVGYIRDGVPVGLLHWRMIALLPQVFRFSFACLKFDRHFRSFRRKCVSMSQKDALESDAFLLRLFHMDAADLITSLKIQKLADLYLNQSFTVVSFQHYGCCSAFIFLQWMTAIYLYPKYEFVLNTEKLTAGFEDSIVIDEALSLEQSDDGTYTITCTDRSYCADFVILTTPPWVTRTLVPITTKEADYSSVHVRQISGTPIGMTRQKWRFFAFPADDPSGIHAIVRGMDGTFLIFARSEDISIDQYFKNYSVLYEKTWQPGFTFRNRELVDAEFGDNIYIGSDINISGAEDSALTGIYSAKCVLEHVGIA